jgi:uncharacterized protein YsxB (DUF464 family)
LIRVVVSLDAGECIRSVVVFGHASGESAGANLVCAAVSALSKTLGLVLDGHPQLDTYGEAGQEGHMELHVRSAPPSLRPWLRGITDFYLTGLRDLARQSPHAVGVELRTDSKREGKRRTEHGS